MDTETIAALAGKAAQLNVFYIAVSLLVLVGVFTFIVLLGERLLGFNLRKFIDNVENQAEHGDVMPGVIAFIIVPAALFGLVIYVALR